ncbi:hypothetical protein C4D60_Mb08t27880 [Musa balbisiana]|uniref:Peptidase S9 prolyl oligopeptidase catalytic domain-containing protein n=1 Tax=Musa balbisiana TaxID=52838 RepID=A0A4V4H995_MUSBA|nr:hypothetical protein C4D60_Mb08t27880 [Musa balbisiana]
MPPLLPSRVPRAKKPPPVPHRNGRILLALLLVLLLGMIILAITTNGKRSGKPIPRSDPSTLKRNHFVGTSAPSQATVDFTNGTDVIWQIPESPKAVLFVAHGCSCRAANFWDRSAACPHCVGLPEDRLIVLGALDRKFAVLTISSSGRCWSKEKDTGTVKWVIEWWIEKNKLQELPLVALGASSGGYFTSALAKEMRFSSVALMIAEGVFGSMGVPVGYPPTLFVHMPKDQHRMRLIERNMIALQKRGVHVKEVRCMEFPLTPTLLSDRIPGLDQAFSVKLFELFQEKGFIDEHGYLRNDGRATPWKQALREREPSLDKFEWIDHIQEELNLAFGYHEMTSLQIDDILDWFESHMGSSSVS